MAMARIASSMATWAAKAGEMRGTGNPGSSAPILRTSVSPTTLAVRGAATSARVGAWRASSRSTLR
ncbi:MAG: hypothetical protein IPG03_00080 [Candidatus Microthrix sp.]|nr:hypothetical protein [Candidatus Microthrix sp.]MBK6500810.1 hypothetical protein [Candidatus Microthrix sp.]